MLLYRLCKKLFPRLQSPMDQVVSQLKWKGLLPEKINALEMFGMHGLWHTMDYINFVDSLDFFEIKTEYLELSRYNLRGYNVRFKLKDSIEYIRNCKARYNFIVSDTPTSDSFYDKIGLPVFLDEILLIADLKTVIILNVRKGVAKDYKIITEFLESNLKSKLQDVFFVMRNELVDYLVICIKF